ncbi:DNA binding, excisionase family domain protein [Bacteroides fragilis str. 3397 T10]|nr:DNA binding, excisionase family domain protein [Bacteroides fragilis str. 3397 T10]
MQNNNRLTYMERLNERLTAIESALKKIDPIESLLERITLLENTIYTTKKVFTFQEACMYIGVSESLLYKLTSSKEIPHYKPRGKMIYFAKEELDEWLLQNYKPTVDEAVRMANEASVTQPFFKQKRYGKRKKN